MTPAEQRFWNADAELEAARAALDALAPADGIEAMQLQGIELELSLIEQQRKSLEVRATSAGRVNRLDLKPGDAVAYRQPVAQLDDPSRFEVVVTLPRRELATVREGEPVSFRVGDARVASTVASVSGDELTAQVEGEELKVGPATVSVELAPRSIFERLRF
jgi:multidrug resistance efflux pump